MFIITIVVLGIILYLAQLNSRINNLEEKLKGNITVENVPEVKKVETDIPQSFIAPKPVTSPVVTPPHEHQDTFAKNLAKFGITVLVLGVIFFLKYIDSQGLIGPVFKFTAGLSFGVILLGIAEYIRNKNKTYTNLLRGAGFLIMYITAFVGYMLFHIISLPITLTLISAILIVSTIISFKENDSISFTVGVGGAYLTTLSLLADIGVNKETYISVLLYMLILNTGIIFVSMYKSWIKDVVIGFVFTWMIFLSIFYMGEFNKNILFIFATLYGLQYLIVFLIQDFRNVTEKVFEIIEATVFLTVINTLVYTVVLYQLIAKTFWFDYVGYIVAILGVFHLAIYGLLKSIKDKQNNVIDLTHFVVGILLVSASIPLQFDGPIVTMVWFLEGVVLSFMTVLRDFKDKAIMYILGFSAIIAGIMHMIYVGKYTSVMDNGLMFINQKYVVWFAVFLLINLIAYIWYNSVADSVDESFTKEVKQISFVLIIIGQILFIGLTSFEIQEFGSYRRQISNKEIQAEIKLDRELKGYNDHYGYTDYSDKYARIQSISRETTFMQLILFIIMTIIYFLIGLIRKNKVVRNMGIITLIITTLLLIGLTWELGPVYRIITFVGFGIALLVVSYLYISKNKKMDIAKTLVLLFMIGFTLNIDAKVINTNNWTTVADVKIPEITLQNNNENQNLYILPIDKDIVTLSKKNDLSDIRIIDKDKNEVPYILVKSNQNTQQINQEKVKVKILENSLTKDNKRIIVIDTNREGLLYNKIFLTHDNKSINFRKKVRVYISDVFLTSSSLSWGNVEQNNVIYNYTDIDNFSVEKMNIDLTGVSSRYLKIELIDDVDFDKNIKTNNRLSISDVNIEYIKNENNDIGLQVKDYLSGKFSFDNLSIIKDIKLLDTVQKDDKSELIFEGNIDVEEIKLNIDKSDDNFTRNLVIQGSNNDANWTTISSGNIYRINSPIYKGEKLNIEIPVSTYNKFKLIIQNSNNKPLNIGKTAQVRIQNVGLIFKTNEGVNVNDLKVIVGNNTELAPVYDIRSIINYFEGVTPKMLSYNNLSKNPDYKPAKVIIPFGERNKVYLNIALLIFIVIIGIFGFFWMRKDKIN